MKRSEVVRIIADTIESVRLLEAEYSDWIIASHIISSIEQAGMAPPLRTPEFTEYGEPNGFKIQERTWEPEDGN